jgi:hypothetical protein
MNPQKNSMMDLREATENHNKPGAFDVPKTVATKEV